jgi:hypothetical protein
MERLTFDVPTAAIKFELVKRVKAEKPASTTTHAAEQADDGDTTEELPMLQGYAIVWNAVSADKRENKFSRMLPGSAKFSSPTLAVYAHDKSKLLGTTDNGTLRIIPDAIGARCEIDLPDTSYARDAVALIKGKYVAGMSFGMTPAKWNDTQENDDKGQPITVRNYEDMLVDELTITPIPSFLQTSVDTMYSQATPARNEHAIKLEEYRIRFSDIGA